MRLNPAQKEKIEKNYPDLIALKAAKKAP